MKKIILPLLLFVAISLLVSNKVKASHAAGAELTYTWVSGSTYDFIYHFYRDCSGVPAPDSVVMCYYDSCDGTSGTIELHKTTKIRGGHDNGQEVLNPCPGSPSTCGGGTIPGFAEWWYEGKLTLTGSCKHWVFSHAEPNRNGIDNLALPLGGNPLYVEATLNNYDDPQNSSAYFTVVPVPYICNNIPYTYNNGAFDANGDSLFFECITPMTTAGLSDCDRPFDETYVTGYSLPSNPLACGSTFAFSTSTGQMSFTPNRSGKYVLTVKVTERKYIAGTWTVVGTVMRDIQVVVLGCNTPNPTLNQIASTISGATFSGGVINACADTHFSACFDAETTDSTGVLSVTDNSAYFSTSTLPVVTYTNMFTDSVRGCISWTPGITDTGLKILTVTVVDSNCKIVPIPISNTFVIPIYVWPVTKILRPATICYGDSLNLRAIGGGDFVWDVLPGGSSTSSMSCTSCTVTTVRPTVTTSYTVHSTRDIFCSKNRDTVTITVVPPPYSARFDTAACTGITIQLNVPVTTPPTGVSTNIKWTPGTYLSSTTISNPTCTPLSTMRYYVNIYYDTLKHCSTVDTVNVKALKYFKLLMHDTSVCKNAPIVVRATGDSSFNYTWTPTDGISDPSSLTPIITADTTRTYTITSKHVACPDTSASFTVTVQPTPLVNAGPDRTICSGDTIHLFGTVVPSTYSNYSYYWTPPSSVTDPYSIATIFKGLSTTTMVFKATTLAGCSGTDTMIVNVVSADFLHVSQDTGICPGDTAHLHVTGDSIVSVLWQPGYLLDSPTANNPLAWPIVTQKYTVSGTNMRNCRDTESVLVTVNPGAVIDLPDSVTIYPGDSYQIDPRTNCLYFQWFPPSGLNVTNIVNPIAQPEVNTRYIVNAATEAGCKTKDSIGVFVADDSRINVPNAFTPGSGGNNILRLLHLGTATLKKFAIYDRWGIKMFETANIIDGWDGTYNGRPQPVGVYVYTVEAYTARGKKIYKQGNVTLLR